MIEIRKMNFEDLDAVAQINKVSYNEDHFTSRFPLNMLRSYYEYILKLNEYAYVAVGDAGEVVGFVIGGQKTKEAINRYIKRNFIKLVGVILCNPSFIVPKMKGLFNRKPSKVSEAKTRLLSIAIADRFKGKGVGAKLIEGFEKGLLEKEVRLYGLSVHKSNIIAVKFYEKIGYRKEFETKEAIYYIKNL